VQTRPEANVKGYGSEAKASIMNNDVFFNIEAKRSRLIVGKFISKRSEHVYIKEFKKSKRSEHVR
jgi:mRNA-degrading endonuclease HigB of HigAB toxin-antitoxin module